MKLTISTEFTTALGFRVESVLGDWKQLIDETVFSFLVHSPIGTSHAVAVHVPTYVVELIKCHTGRDVLPGGPRFMHALAEEVLAVYLCKHADLPSEGEIIVSDLSPSLIAWIDTLKTPK